MFIKTNVVYKEEISSSWGPLVVIITILWATAFNDSFATSSCRQVHVFISRTRTSLHALGDSCSYDSLPIS